MEASFKFSALETAEYDTGLQSFVVHHKLQKKIVAIFPEDIDLYSVEKFQIY
jgi:uncharacterized protein (DUF2344 family)